MPGRLGDDPLSRKRSPSTKDAHPDRPGFAAQQASHNDVFFRRRTDHPQPNPESAPEKQLPGLGENADAVDGPEITEVSDLVRSAQAAKITQGADQLPVRAPMDEPLPPQAEEPIAETEQVPLAASQPVTVESPAPSAQEPAAPYSSQAEPQPQKSEGFFKRLFGRLGK